MVKFLWKEIPREKTPFVRQKGHNSRGRRGLSMMPNVRFKRCGDSFELEQRAWTCSISLLPPC